MAVLVGARPSAGQTNDCGSFAATITDIYCFDLTPAPDFLDAAGTVLLRPAPSPFGIAVSPDGSHRYRLELLLSNLPLDRLPDNAMMEAWATTEFFEPVVNFGPVNEGRQVVGEIARTKFILFVGFKDADGRRRAILRGGSPSSRLQGHDAVFTSPLAALDPGSSGRRAGIEHQHDHEPAGSEWKHPPMHPAIAMSPGMMVLEPTVTPFRFGQGRNIGEIPLARPREQIRLADGDTLDLTAGPVRREINGRSFVLAGYNGQYPGPLICADETATIVVRFHNNIDAPTAVHWHGIRIENAFDGVPGVTQEPVQYGESFEYRVRLPDAGLYWYHPHHREDIYQELGLYGNLLVDPRDENYYNAVDQEEVLVLDDLLLDDDGPVPFGTESANYQFMGRFGNVYLLNGRPDYELRTNDRSITRFFLTNVSNTRTFNLGIAGAVLKVVASDVSRFEREAWVSSIVMAPAERYIVEARFDSVGTYAITNRVQAVNHTVGTFFPEVDTLGWVHVDPSDAVTADQARRLADFDDLRTHTEVVQDIDRYRSRFDGPAEKELVLTMAVDDLPPVVEQTMSVESAYFNPVEWSGTMPMMNWASTGNEVEWILRDGHTGAENMAIEWSFRVGDIVKIRVRNDREAFHAMQHPLHIHGQRFLVLSQNGVRNENLVWKDTVLLPSGTTTELLLELTNPGAWMVHCHIAEHLESGMKFVFEVR